MFGRFGDDRGDSYDLAVPDNWTSGIPVLESHVELIAFRFAFEAFSGRNDSLGGLYAAFLGIRKSVGENFFTDIVSLSVESASLEVLSGFQDGYA